jgi:hypothetical protein
VINTQLQPTYLARYARSIHTSTLVYKSIIPVQQISSHIRDMQWTNQQSVNIGCCCCYLVRDDDDDDVEDV